MSSGVKYPEFESLNKDRIKEIAAIFTRIIEKYNKDIDLRRGVVHDLVVYSRALLSASAEASIQKILESTSLQFAKENPDKADVSYFQRLLDNYGFVLRQEKKAKGKVTVVISQPSPQVIALGTVFVINGLRFLTDKSYAARTTAVEVISDNDVLITATTGGYAFTVTVVAETAGIRGNIKAGTQATLEQTIPNFVRAYATEDFVGGEDAETVGEAIDRLRTGQALRAWSNATTAEATVRFFPKIVNGTTTYPFREIVAASVIGAGEPEMLRDKRSLIPVSSGGRADFYVKTTPGTVSRIIKKTASLVAKTGPLGTWQLALTQDDYPGFYDVLKIALLNEDVMSGFVPISETRGFDTTPALRKPSLMTATDAAYSPYQTAIYQFQDTVTNATLFSIGHTKDYNVLVRGIPYIREIQDIWTSPEHCPPTGDVLVRAAVPCFLSISVNVQARAGSGLQASDVRHAIVDFVNNTGFVGRIPGSLISQHLHRQFSSIEVVSGYSFTGRICRPDMSILISNQAESFTVPHEPTKGVSQKTVAFYTEFANVAVTLSFV